LVLCAVLAPSGAARAQGFGVVGGTTLGEINVSGNEFANVAFTDKFEAAGGVFFAFPLAQLVSFEPEALISDKGSRLNYLADERIRLRYAEFPLIVRLSPPQDSAVRWLRLMGGPYVAYLLDASSRPTGGGRTADLDEAFEAFDWGWLVGLGVDFGRVDVDLRYAGGVADITKGSSIEGLLPPVSGDMKLRNRWFSLLARYRF
jgi:hypothetical protein